VRVFIGLVVLVLTGCGLHSNVLLGGAPPRPAPPEGPSFSSAPRVESDSRDIVLEAHDESSAEDTMRRRCGGNYAVSFIGSHGGEKCSGPTKLYSSRAYGRTGGDDRGPVHRGDDAQRITPRCTAHENVVVHYRCEARPR
jgi:hypothetical protein